MRLGDDRRGSAGRGIGSLATDLGDSGALGGADLVLGHLAAPRDQFCRVGLRLGDQSRSFLLGMGDDRRGSDADEASRFFASASNASASTRKAAASSSCWRIVAILPSRMRPISAGTFCQIMIPITHSIASATQAGGVKPNAEAS